MTTVSFITKKRALVPSPGDLVLLPWLNRKKPAYRPEQVPTELVSPPVPDKKGKFQLISLTPDTRPGTAVVVCRLDESGIPPFRQMRTAVSRALGQCQSMGLRRVLVVLDEKHPELNGAVAYGALTGGYTFDKYLGKKKPPLSVVLHTSLPKSFFQEARTVSGCINFARDTLNEPPVAIHPVSLASLYASTGKSHGLKMSVWDEKRLTREKCGGILAVGAGSISKPRLVTATYSPPRAAVHLALVGKGVTFDSGGYSLKPSKSMTEMKFDMGGAAMMFGATCAIAALKLPIRVTTLLPLVHNAISQTAYNVSDVVTTRSGQTVEVQNTDAEGRIILSDALTIACEHQPDYLIDSATLTGAAVVALGEDIAAIYGDNPRFVKHLTRSAHLAGEDMWPMPLHAGYDEQLRSTIADMRNIGGSWGGSITAALFLKRFVKDVPNWIHMDIAGPGCKTEPLDHLGKGAKGFGIATIVQLARELCG